MFKLWVHFNFGVNTLPLWLTCMKTHNLLQVVNRREQCCAANCEQGCAGPSEQCCAANCEQGCAGPSEQCCAAPNEQCCQQGCPAMIYNNVQPSILLQLVKGRVSSWCIVRLCFYLVTEYFKKRRVSEKITLWILNHVCLLTIKG